MSAKKKKNASTKKNAQMLIRVEESLRDEFVAACQDIDTTASRELRKYIKRFMSKYRNGDFDH